MVGVWNWQTHRLCSKLQVWRHFPDWLIAMYQIVPKFRFQISHFLDWSKFKTAILGAISAFARPASLEKVFVVTIWSGESNAYLYMLWIYKDTVGVGDVRRTICLIKSPGHKKIIEISETKKILEKIRRYCVGGLCKKKYLIQVWLSSQHIRKW